ncbi:MAG: HTTM domain-containing protein, partial [Alphaproteobacteria bacterium]|nr:HTTM domain-containing protein [Alphaproteobacteria bacterium]
SSRIKSATIPAWAVWTLVVQFEIMYLYAGFVKINPDWLQLEPLGMWLNRRSDLALIGPYFSEPWVIAVGAYGVILLHVVGAPLLLWRRTRLFVFVVYASFHTMNHIVFQIGIFPWLTLAATLMFFDPDWPRQVARRLLRPLSRLAGVTLPLVREARGQYGAAAAAISPAGAVSWSQATVMLLMAAWFAVQIGFPLRHYAYPGDVAWNEDGHRFAWRMKLRDKKGRADFVVRDPRSGEEWKVRPGKYLTRRQARKMRTRPDMILQFAHHLERVYREEEGIPDVEVRANVWVSLNGRPRARMVDPDRDLTQIDRSMRHADWILPLQEPLPAERRWARN